MPLFAASKVKMMTGRTFAALVYGVVERGITLDAQIEHLTGRSVEILPTQQR